MPETNIRTPVSTTRRNLLKRWWSTPSVAAVGGALAKAATVSGQTTGFGIRQAAHLLRRAGFGSTTAEVQSLAARGLEGAVDYLVDYEKIDNSAMEADLEALVQDVPRGERVDQGRIDLSRFQGLQAWWTYRMANTTRQLEEKLTLFWHDHFATAFSKVNRGDYMLAQNQLFRDKGLGNFRDLLVEVSRNPAMIWWLDNNTNIKGSPNENFARELMELFSTGIDHIVTGEPNYTEDDIKEVARAFTGWTIRRQGFFFNRNQHDDGIKTVFGVSGAFNGEDIVDIIVKRDATAYFMSKKFWEFFAYEDPEQAVLDELVQVYFDSNYDIKSLVRHMFKMDAFYSDRALFGDIKNPAEFAIGAMRQMGFKFRDARGYQVVSSFMRTMDQDIFNPPSVAGWDGGLSWINTSTLLVRYNMANTVTNFDDRRFGDTFEPSSIVADTSDPEQIVDSMLTLFGSLEVSDDTHFLLVEYLTDGDLASFVVNEQTVESKIRGLAHLIMSLPEYQLN